MNDSFIGAPQEVSAIDANFDGLPTSNSAITQRSVVRKANDIATAKVALSTWGSRILDAALVAYERTRTPVVSFSLSDIQKALGTKSSTPWTQHREISQQLMSSPIYIEHKSLNGGSTFEAQQLVDNVLFENGSFHVTFNGNGLRLLNQETQYTSYSYVSGNKHDALKNSFFQIISANAFTGVYKDPLVLFRQRLNIPDNRWASYGKLKERAITPCLKAVNDSGVFHVELSNEVKQGRKVTGLEFTIRDLRQYGGSKLPLLEQSEIDIELTDTMILQMLVSAGYIQGTHDSKLLETIEKKARHAGVTELLYLESNIAYVEAKRENRADPSSIGGGYLVKALESDFARKDRESQAKEIENARKIHEQEVAKLDFIKLKDDHAILFTNLDTMIRDCRVADREEILSKTKESMKLLPDGPKLIKSIESINDQIFEAPGAPRAILISFIRSLLLTTKPSKYPNLRAFAESRNASESVLELVDSTD